MSLRKVLRISSLLLIIGLLPLSTLRASDPDYGCLAVTYGDFHEQLNLNTGQFRTPPIAANFTGWEIGYDPIDITSISPDGRNAALLVPESGYMPKLFSPMLVDTVALAVTPLETKGQSRPVVVRGGSPPPQHVGGGDPQAWWDSQIQYRWLPDSQHLFYLWPEVTSTVTIYHVSLTDMQGRDLADAVLESVDGEPGPLHPFLMDISDDGNYVIVRMVGWSEDRTYTVWDMRTVQRLTTLEDVVSFSDGWPITWINNQATYLRKTSKNDENLLFVRFNPVLGSSETYSLFSTHASFTYAGSNIFVGDGSGLEYVDEYSRFDRLLSLSSMPVYYSWSPSRRYFVTATDTQTIVVDMTTRRWRSYAVSIGGPWLALWSPDERYAAFGIPLMVIAMDGSGLGFLTKQLLEGVGGEGMRIPVITWTRDGKRLLYMVRNSDAGTFETWSYQPDTQSRRLLVEDAPKFWHEQSYGLRAGNLLNNGEFLITQWADDSGEYSGSVALDSGQKTVLVPRAVANPDYFDAWWGQPMIAAAGKQLVWANYDGTNRFLLQLNTNIRFLKDSIWGPALWFIQPTPQSIYAVERSTGRYAMLLDTIQGSIGLIYSPDRQSIALTDSIPDARSVTVYLLPDDRTSTKPTLLGRWVNTYFELQWSPDSSMFFTLEGDFSRTLNLYSRTGVLLKRLEGLPTRFGLRWAACQ